MGETPMFEEKDNLDTAKMDVGKLMEKVRASVADKISRGVYTDEEIQDISRMELSLKERTDFGMEMEETISWLHANWNPNSPYRITSHRPFLGKILVPLKKILRIIFKPFSYMVLLKQTDINMRITQLLASSLPSLRDDHNGLEQRFEDLLLKYYELLKKHQELFRRFENMTAGIHKKGDQTAAQGRITTSVDRSRKEPSFVPSGGMDFTGYLSFEDRHRGPSHEIKEKQKDYLKYFRDKTGVLDAGCGRGEFLELLSESGVESYGVDTSREMADVCLKKGLKVMVADANTHLHGLEDNSLGGIFAAQLVEHLTPSQLQDFVRLAWSKLSPGGCLVIETINPACLSTFAGPVYLDLTHTKPIHPEAARFLLQAVGFSSVELVYRSPFPQEMKLKEVDLFHRLQRFEDALLNVVNDNFNQLNELIYGFQDYAAIAVK